VADQPNQKTKRHVKNPETFRERALKASEAADKPRQGAKLKQAGNRVTGPIFTPVKAFFGRLGAFKPFRIIGRLIFPAYFRQSWQELRLVTWPSWAESRRLTYAVLVFAVIFGGIIAGVDYGLDKIFRHVLLK
jgi:preprotein translocase SecE subunit